MGTDIHMFVEVRNAEGVWEKVGKIFDNPYYDPSRETKTWEDGYVTNAPKTDEPYEGSNYALFALLADVRNGYGFAGTPTFKPVIPLFPGRGVPSDASPEYRAMVEEDWGHDYSYATLAELQAVNWNEVATFERVGYLDTDEYERIRDTDLTPDTWCGDASGPFVQKITAEVYEREYRNVIKDKAANREEMMSTYIYWRWQDSAEVSLGSFITETIPTLSKLGKPEDVRIVFFFDS